ncbi:MAG: polysaccharide biosynthesis protein [Firmicutes bacterium]|nr:polysaccharide biosynthesis protein [Bacillota bacterium]
MGYKIKKYGLVLGDVVCILISFALALLLRFEFSMSRALPYWYTTIGRLPGLIVMRLVIYYIFGLYSRLWQFASVREALVIALAGTSASVFDYLILHTLRPTGFPRSIIFMAWSLNVFLTGGIRLFMRVRREWAGYVAAANQMAKAGLEQAASTKTHNVLIAGAGEAGVIVARELRAHPEVGQEIVGFVDDDPSKQGYIAAGYRVLGTTKSIPDLVASHNVEEIIIAMPSVPGTVVRQIVRSCDGLGVKVLTIPGVYELLDGKLDVSRIRAIEIQDLLRREEVKTDLEEIGKYLSGKRVLVTGAGGSIGRELSRQVAGFNPKSLILLGHGENDIFEVNIELHDTFSELHTIPVIADIRNSERINWVFSSYKPDVVFHAAAHKHVPLMESNPEEAIHNNVFGTWNVAYAADRYGAERFVLISTDKAVNPVSVMGCSKRAAELLIQALAKRSRTKFMAVRFGNVLGSRGSVIPLFKRQIKRGGPITITHPDMVRYFMTIPEAVQLVIQAAAMGKGGEVFILDMGEPVRIVDLARDLIRLSGLDPDYDVEIAFTGIRPGEKIVEELLTVEEGTIATVHERIFVAKGEPLLDGNVRGFLDKCREFAEDNREGGKAFVHWIREMTSSRKTQEPARKYELQELPQSQDSLMT